MSTKLYTGTFTVLTCCRKGCGITFGVPQWWESKRREDHTSWYCPNGHSQYFPGESDSERYKRLYENEQYRADRLNNLADSMERSRRAVKGHLTRTKRRVAAGVCPCCNRHFKDLYRHMKGQHPDYGNPAGEEDS